MATRHPRQSNSEAALRAKVAHLSRGDAYGEAHVDVDVLETHKSWVFLTPEFAYKLKKPIRYDSIDFRPLETRRVNCQEELRLNRRLARDVYLDVVPLTRESDGTLSLNGRGEAVDWLVKMRRLPGELMLDRMIQQGTLDVGDVRRLATKLACFYQSAAPVVVDGDRYMELLRNEIQLNRRGLTQPDVESASSARDVIDAQLAFLRRRSSLFAQRARNGHVVEGHGDLRPEHICLESEPVIVDCLEFEPRLRTVDALDELAFLAMQCERLDAAWVGELVLDVHVEVTGDNPPEELAFFYKSYRAATWARLAIWRAREPGAKNRERWAIRTAQYLELATAYARRFE